MRDPGNIESIACLNPDYLGFNFFKGSPRFIGSSFSESILRNLPSTVQKVGVFVDEPPEHLLELQNRFKFDYVQLHGNEDHSYCQFLKSHNLSIIKAFPVDVDFDFTKLEPFQPHCEYFLFDTKSSHFGGSGLSFDWKILQNYSLNTPFFLAGGLGLENSEDLLALKHPSLYGYDFNSKIETAPGIKSEQLTKQLIKRIRTS